MKKFTMLLTISVAKFIVPVSASEIIVLLCSLSVRVAITLSAESPALFIQLLSAALFEALLKTRTTKSGTCSLSCTTVSFTDGTISAITSTITPAQIT